MGFLTAFGTGVLQGVNDEQNRVRDERAETTRLAMARLQTTIERRERELEERTKIEQQAAMIARSTGSDPAAVRAALQSGASFEEMLSGRTRVGGRPGGPAAAAGTPSASPGGASPYAALGRVEASARPGSGVTPPANMYGRNADRLPAYEAALAGGPQALEARSREMSSAPENPGGYGNPEWAGGLPPPSGRIATAGPAGAPTDPRAAPAPGGPMQRLAAPAQASAAPPPAAPPPASYPDEAYSDPVLTRHRQPDAPQGPVSRGVMDYVFGRQPQERIERDAVRRISGAYGMSEDRIREMQRPLERTQMPEGSTISRSAFDPERLADPKNFDRPEDFQRAYPGAPSGLYTGGDRDRASAASARETAALRASAAGGKPPAASVLNHAEGLLMQALGEGPNSVFRTTPSSNSLTGWEVSLRPGIAPNDPRVRAANLLRMEARERIQELISEGKLPAAAVNQALREKGFHGEQQAPARPGAAAPAAPEVRGAARPTTQAPQAAPAGGQLRQFRTPAEAAASGLPKGAPFLDANGVRRYIP